MQNAGYFVLLFFVGLASADLSILRVETRVKAGGHHVETSVLRRRFPRTRNAISQAVGVADASILVDNSRTSDLAFSVCRVQLRENILHDVRNTAKPVSHLILGWMDEVAPLAPPTLTRS